jgi:PAS domain-containing protein
MANDTVQLKARIAHLEEELLYAHSVLSQTTETGCFHQSLNRYTSAEAILHDAAKKVRLILPLIGTAFYLINEENADLELRLLQAPRHVTHALPQEWERLLEERLVAQALHTNQTIFRSTRDRDALWILHSIATQSRVRGLFLGLLGIPREDLRDSALSLLHVALANLAHTLESFELYRIMRTTNNELKTLVQELNLARSRFQAIFEFLPMPAAIIDTTGAASVTAINAQGRGYSSCTQQDLPQPLEQIFPCIAGAVDLTRESDSPQSFGPLPCSCSGQQRWITGQVLLVWPNQYLLLLEDRTHQPT